MTTIKTLVFNAFQVNTYVLFDQTRECVIIDPACYEPDEERQLVAFIEKEQLKPVAVLYTHGHIDHILGNNFVVKHFGIPAITHRDSLPFISNSPAYGKTFGFDASDPILPEKFIEDGDVILFGNQQLTALHTPGHAAGSICYYHQAEGFVIAGDVLFSGSIGRTDLPTGDFDLLINSINEKLLTLPNQVKVFPGHGQATTIGQERHTNPFLN